MILSVSHIQDINYRQSNLSNNPDSGLLDKLEIGDAIMADKGFNIADLLESRGVTLNIPPRKNEDQLHSRELIETRRIASLRIHIERVK